VVAKSVLKFGQLDAFRINGRDHLIELLLRRDDDPAGRNDLPLFQKVFPDFPELFDSGTEVLNLVAAPSYMLTYFVDDEDQSLSLSSSSPEFKGAFDDLAHGDSSVPISLGVRP
jgi:hypothetical protein